ncbi:MAG: YitT family protein [Clostridia bacterium]|nr:YitT family protein [Clostridia bacterium]
MSAQARRSQLQDYVIIALLAMLMALNYQVFILNNAFAPAGLSGINTMIQYLFHFSVGYMSLIVNIPLALITYFRVDRQFALRTATNVIVFSVTLLLLQNNVIDVSRFVYHTDDGRSTLLAPVAAGIINGFIFSNSIKHGGSTGGMDYVAAMIHKNRPEYSMVHISFAINIVVASISYFVYDFKIEPVILCIVYSYLTTRVSDHILQGGKQAIRAEMITAHPEEITRRLINELHHSATIVRAEGGYSHKDKTMVICVINKHQVTRFTDIISEYPDTFACITGVSETLGNFRRDVK